MAKQNGLTKGEQKDLDKKMAQLELSPDDAMAASRVGYLLNKAGKAEDASTYLWNAFRNFIEGGQYSMAVMVADELLSLKAHQLEIMHELSKVAEQKDLEIPVLRIYKTYKGFHKIPLFSRLSELEFLQLLKASRYHDIRQDKKIVKEGAKGQDIYLIVEGDVRVHKKGREGKDVLLGKLTKGDFLGEMAYVSDRRRNATVIADGPCQVLSWEARAIRQLNDRHPEITQVLFQSFWERSLDTVVRLSPLFSHLEPDKRKRILNRFQSTAYEPGEIVLQEGEENAEGTLYMIKKGEAVVFTREKGNEKRPLATLKVGDLFGEYSALSNRPCMATVKARTPLQLLTLDRDAFAEIILNDTEAARILDEIQRERMDAPLLQMSYFQLIQEIE